MSVSHEVQYVYLRIAVLQNKLFNKDDGTSPEMAQKELQVGCTKKFEEGKSLQ